MGWREILVGRSARSLAPQHSDNVSAFALNPPHQGPTGAVELSFVTPTGGNLAKRNYGYEKYQKELKRQKKKEEKEHRKQERAKEAADSKPPEPGSPDAPSVL